jgi:hypothetical protein
MANINGIPVENITNINGVEASFIQFIVGIPTTSIPGWPTGGGCVTRTFGYADLFFEPRIACAVFFEQPINYFYDETLNVLYGERESCGGVYAPQGYYSDGVNIYRWITEEYPPSFTQIGICR